MVHNVFKFGRHPTIGIGAIARTRSDIRRNGGHFEIQDGRQSKDGKKCYQWISRSRYDKLSEKHNFSFYRNKNSRIQVLLQFAIYHM